MFKRTLIVLAASALMWVFVTVAAYGQEYSEQDAINLALSVPEFAAALEGREDWYARAYDTGNRFGIWRVQFYDAEGGDMGFADVNPEEQAVYVYECYYGAQDRHREAAQPVLEAYLRPHPEILRWLEDAENAQQHPIYVDYDPYNDWWGVYIAAGPESLYAVVRFAERGVHVLDEPHLVRIYFAEIKSFDEWFSATSQEAVVVAFADHRVGDALHRRAGWTTESQYVSGSLWKIAFYSGEEWLGEATVDMASRTVLEFTR